MLSNNSSVSRRNDCRRLSSKSGNRSELGCTLRRLRSCSHWPAKLSTSACDFGSASMRRTCAVQHRRILQLALARQPEQLVIGNAAPQEERQPRSQFEVADAIAAAGGTSGRIALDAEQKLRAGQNPLQRQSRCRLRSRRRAFRIDRSCISVSRSASRHAAGDKHGGPVSKQSAARRHLRRLRLAG